MKPTLSVEAAREVITLWAENLGAPPRLTRIQRDRLMGANTLDLAVYARQTTLRRLSAFGLVEVTSDNWDKAWAPLTPQGVKLACVLNLRHWPESDRAARLLRRALSSGLLTL